MSAAPLHVVREGFPNEAGLDIALSRALLLKASEGETTETFRLNRPGRVVAFGRRDTISPGYASAAAAARKMGYEAVERLAGGRAALFHEGTLAFSWSIPDPLPRDGITARFTTLSELILLSLARLGIAAEVGELPGEYCPGTYSVHAGPIKVMGVGQRLARHAAHIGGVIVVNDSHQLRDRLTPVYEALDLAWNPATAGALEDVSPGLTLDDVETAVLSQLGENRTLVEASFTAETLALARDLAVEHRAP